MPLCASFDFRFKDTYEEKLFGIAPQGHPTFGPLTHTLSDLPGLRAFPTPEALEFYDASAFVGVPSATVRYVRQATIRFVLRLASISGASRSAACIAAQYLHKYWVKHSIINSPPLWLAVAALSLGCKILESGVRAVDLVDVANPIIAQLFESHRAWLEYYIRITGSELRNERKLSPVSGRTTLLDMELTPAACDTLFKIRYLFPFLDVHPRWLLEHTIDQKALQLLPPALCPPHLLHGARPQGHGMDIYNVPMIDLMVLRRLELQLLSAAEMDLSPFPLHAVLTAAISRLALPPLPASSSSLASLPILKDGSGGTLVTLSDLAKSICDEYLPFVQPTSLLAPPAFFHPIPSAVPPVAPPLVAVAWVLADAALASPMILTVPMPVLVLSILDLALCALRVQPLVPLRSASLRISHLSSSARAALRSLEESFESPLANSLRKLLQAESLRISSRTQWSYQVENVCQRPIRLGHVAPDICIRQLSTPFSVGSPRILKVSPHEKQIEDNGSTASSEVKSSSEEASKRTRRRSTLDLIRDELRSSGFEPVRQVSWMHGFCPGLDTILVRRLSRRILADAGSAAADPSQLVVPGLARDIVASSHTQSAPDSLIPPQLLDKIRYTYPWSSDLVGSVEVRPPVTKLIDRRHVIPGVPVLKPTSLETSTGKPHIGSVPDMSLTSSVKGIVDAIGSSKLTSGEQQTHRLRAKVSLLVSLNTALARFDSEQQMMFQEASGSRTTQRDHDSKPSRDKGWRRSRSRSPVHDSTSSSRGRGGGERGGRRGGGGGRDPQRSFNPRNRGGRRSRSSSRDRNRSLSPRRNPSRSRSRSSSRGWSHSRSRSGSRSRSRDGRRHHSRSRE